jgi:hypothetical protein
VAVNYISGSRTQQKHDFALKPSILLNICIFIVLDRWNNSSPIDMSPHSDTLSWFRANQSFLFLLNATCLAEKQQIPSSTNCKSRSSLAQCLERWLTMWEVPESNPIRHFAFFREKRSQPDHNDFKFCPNWFVKIYLLKNFVEIHFRQKEGHKVKKF